MTSQRWQQIDRLLDDVLDQEPARRNKFLQEACREDPDLREEVESLLAALHQTEDILEDPPGDLAAELFIGEDVWASNTELVGNYRILRSLASGGMGEVYLAEDTHLGRQVALKRLPSLLTHNPNSRARLLLEAQTAAVLDHPNICTIHEIEEVSGEYFIVMQYVEGETLKSRMEREKPDLTESLAIALQIAEALTAAHSRGIIHRDIKPQNIMITASDQVKVMDFGLAQIVANDNVPVGPDMEGEQSTPHYVAGTPPYMSPEQVRGEPPDARSDIFSLGALLYELMTGHSPFASDCDSKTLNRILHFDPPPIADFYTDAPPEIERIIRKALSKDKQERYPSASELTADLLNLKRSRESGQDPAQPNFSRRRVGSFLWLSLVPVLLILTVLLIRNIWKDRPAVDIGPTQIKSLAVLPLRNLSADPALEYFADGMTEELIASLGRIKSLRVISRTSVMEYKNQTKPLPKIAKDLSVDAVVEGSVLLEGNHVRITTQLIHGATDRHLWAESYERDLRDVPALQNEVARTIAEEIKVVITAEEESRLSAASPVHPEAYRAYLRGLNHQRSPDLIQGWIRATREFQRAVQLDPNFAKAFAELSQGHSAMFHFGVDHSNDRLMKAKQAVDRAFVLQPDLPEAHLALGIYYYWGLHDYDEALKELSIAQKDLPSSIRVFEGLAMIYRRLGHLQAALENFSRIIELNPRDATTLMSIAATHSTLREYSEADAYFKKSIALQPDQALSYALMARNRMLWKGSTTEARAILEKTGGKRDAFFTLQQFEIELFDRNYEVALIELSHLPEVTEFPGYLLPKSAMAGDVYRLMNRSESAKNSYRAALTILEKKRKDQPENPAIRRSLSLVYAGLGHKIESIREAKLAIELQSNQDATRSFELIENLAYVYATVDEPDAALDQIEYLLSIPCDFSIPLLKLDPRWDPLRNDPRYRRIVGS